MSGAGPERVVGLMVGTSLDGIDAACVAFPSDGGFELEDFVTLDFAVVRPERLRAIASGAATSAAELSGLGFALARDHARAVEAVDRRRRADLIGAHGVTVAHAPGGASGHGLQLLSGAALAAFSRRDVACDFRGADIALGGEGAPLAPVVDLRLRASADEDRIVLNLGGISNYSALPAGVSGADEVRAGDAGPANLVLDGWMRRHAGRPFDEGGALARSGRADPAVVEAMLDDPWFRRPRPRSGGREQFGEAWLDRFLELSGPAATAADRMATLVSICARAVADQIESLGPDWRRSDVLRLLLTGGGRHNRALVEELARRVGEARVEPIEAIGENGDAKEAVDFAWLARERRRGRSPGTAAVTGARRDTVAGALYSGEDVAP